MASVLRVSKPENLQPIVGLIKQHQTAMTCSGSPKILIDVYISHYNNQKWLLRCLNALQLHQSLPTNADPCTVGVRYNVVTMETTQEQRDSVIKAVGNRARVIQYPQNGKGGEPLPKFFQLVANETKGKITVVCDVDVLVLSDGWDMQLLAVLFSQSQYTMAAINPRQFNSNFKDVAEWNFLAYNTEVHRNLPFIQSTQQMSEWGLYDFGHWFQKQAVDAGKKVFLFHHKQQLIEGKSPAVCEDQYGRPFALHMFYTTRKQQDDIGDEAQYIVTPEQELCIVEYALSRNTTQC
ncbi:hypothetical protein MIR68_012524 [Amoeboaphelidium protococcarum]|nr:hypothetical protein MIR68_012524 [Amoeboaphelidium protococcarum]